MLIEYYRAIFGEALMGHRSNGWFRYVVGTGLIFLGAGILLERLGLIHYALWSYWPVLLIIIGIGILVKKK